MFIYLDIDNICGIDNKISINFLAEPRKKTKKETVVEIKSGKNINKLTGILGCNASGKSSILKAICAIDYFLSYNARTEKEAQDNKRYIRKIEDILPKPNINRGNEYSTIELSSFIENCEIPGVYTYKLQYSLDIEKEIKVIEKLYYKKDFNSKDKEIIHIEKKKLESEIGIKYNYKESFIEEIKKDYYDEKIFINFMDKYSYYKCFYEYITKKLMYLEDDVNDTSLQHYMIREWIEQDKETIDDVVKLIDKTIERFELEKVEGTNRKIISYYNLQGEKLDFLDMSNGTRKFLTYIFLLLVTLNSNGIILIDEIENSLHMDLVKFILKLITLKISNSQLIFTTNNQYTLDEDIMRIDQMYYLDKNEKDNIILKRFSESLREEKETRTIRSDETIRLKFKEKTICRGFQPSFEKINNFVESMEDKKSLNKYKL